MRVVLAGGAALSRRQPVERGVVAAQQHRSAQRGSARQAVDPRDRVPVRIVAGKRHAELNELGEASSGHRQTLGEYSDSFLNYVRAVTSGVAITGYALWAFERAAEVGNTFWFRLSIAPFVLAILRYALTVEQGGGGAPEEVVLRDRMLQLLGVVWLACFAIGVHAG